MVSSFARFFYEGEYSVVCGCVEEVDDAGSADLGLLVDGGVDLSAVGTLGWMVSRWSRACTW